MQRPYKGKWLLLPVVLIALLVSPSVFAQETTAGLQGTVKDPSGASVANATVEVSGPSGSLQDISEFRGKPLLQSALQVVSRMT
jgi:hypothetical protein